MVDALNKGAPGAAKCAKRKGIPEDVINNNINLKSEDQHKLKREVGLLNACAIGVGGMIGSGIFIAPKGIISHVGSIGMSLVMWVFCGLISLLGGFCYTELGTTFPSAGGQYTYIYEAFGPILAFLSLWSHTFIFIPITNAIFGLALAKYIVQPFFTTSSEIPDLAIQLIAAASICLVTFLCCLDIKKTTKVLNIFMILKISALVLIVLGGIFFVSAGNVENYENIWENSKVDPGSLVFASFSGSFAFGGWSQLVAMMEELKEPNKNLPRGIMISLIMVTGVYLLTNASYFAVLTRNEILASDAVAVTFVEKLIGIWGWIVPIFVSISIFGSLSIHTLTTARGCMVGSRCGQLPEFISLITVSHKSPAPAAVFLSALSLLFLFTADVYKLIEFGGITGGFYSVLTVVALMYLRWKKPSIERPFKVNLVIPVLYLLVCVTIFVIPIYVQPVTAGIGAIMTLSGIPVYYAFISKDKLDLKWVQHLNEKVTMWVQKLFVAVKEDL